jgi:hypothetical protein
MENFILGICVYVDQMVEVIDNTNWGVIFTTSVLVIITIYYAWQTRRTVQVLKESNKIQIMPDIRLILEFYRNPKTLIFRITNTGRGPAKDLDIKFTDINTKMEISVHRPLFSPGGMVDFLGHEVLPIPKNQVYSLQYLEKNQTSIKFEWTCKDLLNNEYNGVSDHDITDFVKILLTSP